MADFTAIADRAVEIIGSADPSQFQTAYDVMKDEEKTQNKESNWESELAIMSRLGPIEADTILTKIESAVPARLVRMIQSERGVNLADPQTIGLISSLVAAKVLTQAEADDLLATNTEDVAAWPGITKGQVYDALSLRAGGKI